MDCENSKTFSQLQIEENTDEGLSAQLTGLEGWRVEVEPMKQAPLHRGAHDGFEADSPGIESAQKFNRPLCRSRRGHVHGHITGDAHAPRLCARP
jgi:hypothetical protein